MALAIAGSASQQQDSSATNTFSLAVPSGTDQLILVLTAGFRGAGEQDAGTVTFGGVALTNVGSASIKTSGGDVSAWYLINPTVSTANIVVTYPTTMDAQGAVALRLTGAKQITQPDTAAEALRSGVDPQSISGTTAADNSMSFSIVNMNNNPSSTLGANQTRIAAFYGGYIDTSFKAALTPAGAVTHTYSSGGSDDSHISLVTIAPSISGVVDSRVNSGDNDNFYRQNSSASPSLSDNANDVPVGLFDANQTAMGGQMRFLNITVPVGATITEAHLELMSSGNDSANTVNSRIRGKDVDNATIDTTTGGFENPPFTTAVVDWDAIAAWTNGTTYNSPDIKTIIQEIIDRPGWASGNAMVIIWEDMEKRTTQSDNTLRRARSYNNVAANSPILHIEYTSGGGVVTVRSMAMLGVGS